jgi:geranylgeranyl pyrophosphate synthase
MIEDENASEMDEATFTVPVPSWAKKELEYVHTHVRETLPETLQSFWDSSGFGLPGFNRPPLRPYLVLLTARHYGCTGLRPLRLAASIQMIHIASLLHDRLGTARQASGAGEDADAERHQREALDILLGDFCFSKASRLIVEDGETRIIQEHIQTSLESAETQASVVNLHKKLDEVDPEKCFELVADKVSLLLTLGMRVGAILGRARKEEEEALSAFGFALGRVVRVLEDLATWDQLPPEGSPLPSAMRFSHPLILLWEREGTSAWKEATRPFEASGDRDWRGLRDRLDNQGYMAVSKRVAFGFAEQALRQLDGWAETEEVGLLKAVPRFHLMSGEERGQEVTL